MYHFYYDETEHSRIINYDTVKANNYYENFVTSIVGWKVEDEKEQRRRRRRGHKDRGAFGAGAWLLFVGCGIRQGGRGYVSADHH